MAPISTEELTSRISAAEKDISEMRLTLAKTLAEMAGELKAIRIFMDTISQGLSPNCLKHDARLTALELELTKKADASYAETTRKSIYAAWGVIGGVSVTIITLMVVHMLK